MAPLQHATIAETCFRHASSLVSRTIASQNITEKMSCGYRYLTAFLAAQTVIATPWNTGSTSWNPYHHNGNHPPQSYQQDKLGGVASENKICSNIGIELLKQGGNAADALVGTTLCVGVIGMQHSGIGGGG